MLAEILKLFTKSLQDAVNTVVNTLQAAVPIARIELLDEVFQNTQANSNITTNLPGPDGSMQPIQQT